MNAFEQMKATLTEAEIPFETTDDSAESEINDELDTVIVLKPKNGPGECYIFFTKEGAFKEIDVI